MDTDFKTDPLRALIVDDDRAVAAYYGAILAQEGYDVRLSHAPAEALAEFPVFAPELVVIDYHMPAMNGAELSAKLRRMDGGIEAGILLVSADHSEQTLTNALRLGITSFLAKPVSPSLFISVCRTLAINARQLKALMRENAFQRKTLDEHSIVSAADAAGDIIYVNQKFVEISGYAESELIGKNHRILKSGLHPPAFYRAMWDDLTAGRIWHGEICNRRKNGALYWVSATIVPFMDKNGLPERYISIRTDITALKEGAIALIESEARLSKLLSSAQDAVIMMDPNGNITLWNEMAERIFGYAAPDVLGRPLHDTLAPPGLQKKFEDNFGAFKETGAGPVVGRLVELVAKRRDGSEFPIELSLSSVNLNGQWHAVGMLRDITVRREIETELVAAKEMAESANRAKSDFLSSMSHELRTPLNAILGFGQILEADGQLNANQHDSVQEIMRAGTHLLNLVNEMLDLARIESGMVQCTPEPVVPCELTEECFNLVRPLAQARAISLATECAFDGRVMADRVRLKQVLLNLLSNAIKYNRDGGSVVLTCAPATAGFLRLNITDTGVGIDPAKISDLFQPFSRLGAEAGSVEGTGIGLTIAQKLVRLMGGEIGVVSEPAVGTTFWIDLPQAGFPEPQK